MQPKYKRVLLKLSGEALAGDQKFGLNHDVIAPVVDQIVQIHNMGVEVGLRVFLMPRMAMLWRLTVRNEWG